jgi:hypothetical protein
MWHADYVKDLCARDGLCTRRNDRDKFGCRTPDGRSGGRATYASRLLGISPTEFETRYRDRLASVSGLFLGDTLVTCAPAEAPGTCSSKTRALRRSPSLTLVEMNRGTFPAST